MTLADDHAPNPLGKDNRLSRREFLVRTAASASAASVAFRGAPFARAAGAASAAGVTRVVRVRSEHVVTMSGIHEGVLADLVEIAVKRATGKKDGVAAWQSILKPDDVVGLKFNRSGAEGLGTTDAMLRVLVDSLSQAGFEPSRLVAIEVTPAARKEVGALPADTGWGDRDYDFGSGTDRLASWLDQVTAIVNVPFLKDHNLAGISCCLKNLSHAAIKHPAQFHSNGCSPYIGDIVALPQIREKLRLHLVNGLRIVFDGGPEAFEDNIWDAGLLVAGLDPVAVDTVSLKMLDRVRTRLSLPRVAGSGQPPAYLEAAASRGLGTNRQHAIEMEKLKL